MSTTDKTRAELVAKIRLLKPWHQNIQVTEDMDIQSAFESHEIERDSNDRVSFVDLRQAFIAKMTMIFPKGLEGKQFLDCACNAGGYCFWARELGASAVGFDVRQHWIDQARFLLENRTVSPTDKIRFEVSDLMKIPALELPPADVTLFKGIFYHLADPIQGLKIAADMTTQVLWFNSRIIHSDNQNSLFCQFESSSKMMSGVHSLSWAPTGPRVVAMILYWLGFTEIWHIFTRNAQDNERFGRMELIAARSPGLLDCLVKLNGAVRIETADFKNALVADAETKAMF